MSLVHLHLLLNHFPIIGTFVGLALLITSRAVKSDDLEQASLAFLTLIALVAIPTYMSGNAAQQGVKDTPGFSPELVQAHQGAAFVAFIFMEITGAAAVMGLWKYSRIVRPAPGVASRANATIVLILAVVTAGLMAIAGNTGGDIRHPEILNGPETTWGVAAFGTRVAEATQYFVADYSRWVWPALETLHFFGLILLIGALGVLNARILGFMKELPVAPLHKFIPWALAGFAINIVTGFLFFVGMPPFYTNNLVFQLKILTIMIAGGQLLLFYCTGALRAWERLGPGQDAPFSAKFIAASSLVLWIAIIVLGRYIPYTEVPQ
jgi:hypothetical protein